MRKAILFFLIPAFICILGIIAVSSNKEVETVRTPAAYGPGTGYALQPEVWTITASSHYKWDNGTSPGGLYLVAIIVFAAGGAYVYWIDREVKWGTWVILAFLWFAGLASLFGTHVAKYNSKQYVKVITAEQYEANKGNLDAIFQP